MKTLHHKYRDEILIPYAALDGNIDFILTKTGDRVTSNGVAVSLELVKTIHALSEEGKAKIQELYGIRVEKYLQLWYDSLDWGFNSLELLNIKITKK